MCIDFINLSQDVVNMVCGYISDNFGKKYLLESLNQYVSKENLQEVYEVICFFDVNVMVELLKDMEVDVQKLYQLIWCQFVVCQMILVKYDFMMLIVGVGDFCLKACGCILCFDGWIKVMFVLCKGDEDCILLVVNKGDVLMFVEFILVQYFIKLLVCFSEVLLVKELEKCGIGCLFIYVLIILIIQDCGYV